LIDEMNLAQQSVLEGLNAILDHRRTVFVPDLNREFTCHPNFMVFACQNPSASGVSGRKTLPKSFLNRFNKICLEDLTQDDYRTILSKSKGIQNLQVQSILDLALQMEDILKSESISVISHDEGMVNMRDF
jgi:midasin (ATPase involved in ribosome maturation)